MLSCFIFGYLLNKQGMFWLHISVFCVINGGVCIIRVIVFVFEIFFIDCVKENLIKTRLSNFDLFFLLGIWKQPFPGPYLST